MSIHWHLEKKKRKIFFSCFNFLQTLLACFLHFCGCGVSVVIIVFFKVFELLKKKESYVCGSYVMYSCACLLLLNIMEDSILWICHFSLNWFWTNIIMWHYKINIWSLKRKSEVRDVMESGVHIVKDFKAKHWNKHWIWQFISHCSKQ
jgi:hypothetical protein